MSQIVINNHFKYQDFIHKEYLQFLVEYIKENPDTIM